MVLRIKSPFPFRGLAVCIPWKAFRAAAMDLPSATPASAPFLDLKRRKPIPMKNRKHKPAQNAQELMTDLRNLVVEAEQMAADSVSNHSREAFEAIRDRYESAQERLSDFYAGTRKKVTAGAHYTDEVIREKPYQALAIAAGVAVLVGLLLGRRSKD